ncbi:sensor histidine kinase [Paenibacillus sp. GCM10023248]|uniref:sensor histidine kinase n=2 Tax=Bacillales TaxID=1385 RepID=UPI0023781416|nr:ATP-binding protein [Paenibacillus sp. MAHUQ-63]MDD9266860.1 ATP-binding protein [Paenibacillus sp. MAHUQ-63]MDR6881060.1 two-component system sensor histidine kinase YcbA [Bacillus sp. 3255]
MGFTVGGERLRRLQNEGLQMILIAIVTAIAGEFKITPFSGEVFRIGLGSSAFLLCLLLLKHLPYMYTGLITGVTVLLFRSLEDGVTMHGTVSLGWCIQVHLPAMLYYMAFAAGMSLVKPRLGKSHPLVLGLFLSLIDLMSNEIELLARSFIFDTPYKFSEQLVYISVIALVRSYFVVGIYSSVTIHQMRVLHNEQQKRMEQMLNTNSGLYGEVFYLRKSMETIEGLTAKSHNLYEKVNGSGLKSYARTILEITQQIHEVKKDSQRILAGLLKLFDREFASDMRLAEIVDFAIKSNLGYSSMLGKHIQFTTDLRTDYDSDHYLPLLTVLNNLLSNAVEAIEEHGRIHVSVREQGAETILTVSDTGMGIAELEREMIFAPGYTTKFNQEGFAATGIGLSHVRDIVHSLGGDIHLRSDEPDAQTTFVITLLTDTLKKGA